ncbi:MAG: ComF family protein [Candidatus Moraniibacteriota bacterium]|nr:MAG: ComF family protein [Candidatus Moranbacteria bacterium]
MIHLFPFFLFPASCLCCSKRTGDRYLCNYCRDHLPIQTKNTCPVCQKVETDIGQKCLACYEKSPLEGVFGALSYKETIVKECIETVKYRFIPSLLEPLSIRLANRLRFLPIPLPDLFIPIPLHPFRYRHRGFNQSEFIAKHLSYYLLPEISFPIRDDILKRIRFTKSQVTMQSRKERVANLKDAFSYNKNLSPEEILGKRIWLIDDVATTNTTLSECALVLKNSGAKEVWGITLAR